MLLAHKAGKWLHPITLHVFSNSVTLVCRWTVRVLLVCSQILLDYYCPSAQQINGLLKITKWQKPSDNTMYFSNLTLPWDIWLLNLSFSKSNNQFCFCKISQSNKTTFCYWVFHNVTRRTWCRVNAISYFSEKKHLFHFLKESTGKVYIPLLTVSPLTVCFLRGLLNFIFHTVIWWGALSHDLICSAGCSLLTLNNLQPYFTFPSKTLKLW